MNRSWKRDAAVFLASQCISLLGSSLVQYALMWHITLKTKSGTMMALYIICGFLPNFFISPFAGVWADRYDRKKIIMLADGLIATVTLALAAAFAAGFDVSWLIFLAAGLRAVGSAVQQPAVGAFLPQIVPQDRLTKVNGINGSLQAGLMLFSPMLSGVLMTFAPLSAVFLIDVLTALLAIGALALFLKSPGPASTAAKAATPYFSDMKDGLRYIAKHRYLKSFFAYLALFFLMISPSAFLTPLQTARTFGPDVWRLTAIEIVFATGMMLGGALIAAWGGFRNRMVSIVLANGVMAACAIGLGLIPNFWIYLACMGVFGIALPLFNTPSTVILQERVENEYMGRVFSVMSMISSSLMPMGMLIFGPLAEKVRVEWILVGSGAVLLSMALILPLNRRLMEAGRAQSSS
jgi:MFS transporter, DHA3 family, macrolide efflux protein